MEPVTMTQVQGVGAQQRPEISSAKKLKRLSNTPVDQKPDSFVSSSNNKQNIGLVALTAVVIATPFAIIASKGKKSINQLKEMVKKGESKIGKLTEELTKAAEELSKTNEKLANTTTKVDQSTQVPLTKVQQLTTSLATLGSAAAIMNFINTPKNKDDLAKKGFSEDEINEAVRNAQAPFNVDVQKEFEVLKTHVDQTLADKGISSVGPVMNIYTEPYYGLNLLSVRDYATKINKNRSEVVMESIQNAAKLRTQRDADETVAAIKAYYEKFPQLTSVWGITAEYNPIKVGGLGDVPRDIQNNLTELGIDNPEFIPMYLKAGVSEFKQSADGRCSYRYKGKEWKNLYKMVGFSVQTYRNGQSKLEEVEFYAAEVPVDDKNPDSKKKILVFVKADNYLKENIYDSTTTAEEVEKFAFLDKAIYELAKYKINRVLPKDEKEPDYNLIANLKVYNNAAIEKLGAPKAMILNDWHAGTIAGLMRYKAPMEYNYDEIKGSVMEALRDMPLLMIGHNLRQQGKSHDGSGGTDVSKERIAENVINTLFDHYAIAIAKNANSGLGIDALNNTLLLEKNNGGKHFNSLFMGVSLSDWFVPVSRNYGKEIINDQSKSYYLQALLQERELKHLNKSDKNTITGIVNGTDKHVNDMYFISKNNRVSGLEFRIYDESTPIDTIMQERKENKALFFDKFLEPVLKGTYVAEDIPEIIKPEAGGLNITKEQFMDAPFLAFAHRLSSQKGAGLLKGAIFRLFDNWESLPFKDKPKPYFLVAGPHPEAHELSHLDALRTPQNNSNNDDRINHTLCLKNNMPNAAIQAACEYFIAPSTFEPCGLIQGESFAKGTPVIVTHTGGFVDTVKHGETGFLAKNIDEESVYNVLVEALDTYYNKPESYKQMVQNALNVDLSWAKEGRQGSIYEYTDKLGYDRNGLPDLAEERKKNVSNT